MRATDHDFEIIIRHTPLVAIDFIAMDQHRRVLLGLRRNEPAKGFWFVPGGRIYKDETIEKAFARIYQAEVRPHFRARNADLVYIAQHFYDTNNYGKPGFGTHYVTLAYKLKGESAIPVVSDKQHSCLGWFKVSDLLADPKVHPNVKAYFSDKKPTFYKRKF